MGFPGGKESVCQCRRRRRHGFDPWVRKIPWRRKWQPTLVFEPGKSHGQRSLAGYSPWSTKRVGYNLVTKQNKIQLAIYLINKYMITNSGLQIALVPETPNSYYFLLYLCSWAKHCTRLPFKFFLS